MKALFALLLFASVMGEAQARLFPSHDIPAFLVERLNLRSFRSSLRPRMTSDDPFISFADLSMTPTRVTSDVVEFDGDDWFYSLTVLRRNTGMRSQSIDVCFVDRSKGGSYYTIRPLRLSYVDGQAMARDTKQSNDCKTYSR